MIAFTSAPLGPPSTHRPDRMVGALRGRGLAGLFVVMLASVACDHPLENPIKPIVVTTPVVIRVNIISTQIDPVTLQLQAFAQFTDGSTQEVTTVAGWGSSNNAVATVTTAGLTTIFSNGIATITATHEGVSGSLPLNVTGLP